MAQTSLSQIQESTKIGTLAKNTVIALVLQVVGVALTYMVQVYLARWMGTREYGIYEYAVTWSLLLAIPAGLGLPHTVVRFISEYRVKQDWRRLKGLILSSWQFTVVVGLLLPLGGTGIISLLNHYHSFSYSSVLLVGIWLVPLQALVQLQEDMGRGAEQITLAYGPTKVLWPLLLLAGGFILFEQHHSLTSIPMTRLAIVTLLTVVLFQVWLLWENFDRETAATEPIYAPREWLGVAMPLLLHRTFRELLRQTDILMVGSFLGAGAVGIYSAASKTALWTSFTLQTVSIVAAPAFAIFYAQGDRQGLQKIVSNVSLWIFAPSLVIAFGLIMLAQPVLAVFGTEFALAHWELKILVVGQLVNALCGSVGTLLTMTGYQNKVLRVSSCTALINLGLNAIAIPLFGTLGAAMTTALSLIAWNICLTVLVVKYIGVNPSIFYSFFKLSRPIAAIQNSDR